MHTAESPFGFTEGDIALNQPRIQTTLFELSLAPTPSEKAPVVLKLLRLYNERAGQFRFRKNHWREQLALRSEQPAAFTVLLLLGSVRQTDRPIRGCRNFARSPRS